MQAPDRLLVLCAGRAEAENAAHDDRSVTTWRLELVKGRHPQRCARRPQVAVGEHVGGDIAAVDVDALVPPGHEQSTRAAAGVEHGGAQVRPV